MCSCVIRTEVCAFSAFKVHPGHGIRYVRTDNKVVFFRDSKSKLHYLKKRKPGQFRWSAVYRRIHKSKKTLIAKKKVRKVAKVQRAVAGTTVAAIQKKRVQKPEERTAAREAALAELKKRRDASKNTRAEVRAKQQGAQTRVFAKPAPAQKGSAPKGR